VSLTAYSGRPILGLNSIVGLTIPALAPTWMPFTRSAFLDPTLAPSQDPQAVLVNPITVNDATGDVVFDMTRNGTSTLVCSNSAFWPLNWPAGWVGDGQYNIGLRFTPQSAGATRYVGCVVGLCDNACNPVGGQPQGLGACTVASNNSWTTIVTTNAGQINGTSTAAYPADGPVLMHTICSWGRIGNEANVGLQTGQWAGSVNAHGPIGTPVFVDATGAMTVTGGLRPFLSAGWYNPALLVGVATFTMRIEWCLLPAWPAGEWPP
jgi:hypothetical protein